MSAPDPRRAPTFGELLAANARMLGVVLLYAAIAFGAWRGLAWLFPDIAWLRLPGR